MKKLINKFNEEVLQAVEDTKKIGYTATRFIQMLQQAKNNAHEIVPRLVNKNVTLGLEYLWEHKRLDLSVEAIVIKPEYKEIFPAEIIDACKKKLTKYGYKF